jgi:signal transduction histidine kinase
MSLFSFIFYENAKNAIMDEHKKDLYKSFFGLSYGRGFMMGRGMGRIYSYYIAQNGVVIQDPFSLGEVKEEGIYKTNDGYYVLIVKRDEYFIGKDITSTIYALDRLKRNSILFVLLSIIPSMAIGFFMSNRFLSPIRRIIKEAKNVDIRRQDRIEFPKTKDELWELVNTLNMMLDRIEKVYKREEEFSSDVSHELKTPLTSILGYIKMLRRWGKEDKKILEESLNILEETTQDMVNMVDTLLETARVSEDIIFDKFSVKEFLEEIKEKYAKIYQEYEFRIILNKNEEVSFPKKVLEIILGIFIENGIKNSLDKKLIDIGYNEGKFFVRDYGKGIPEGEISKIFERFYKLDKSRSSKGYGLGLSLAKKLSDVAGLEIEVESKEGEGSTFYIERRK